MRFGHVMRTLAAAALLVLLLAGCAAPQPLPRARSGDFAVVDLVALRGDGREALNLSGQRAVLADGVPVRLPEGWDAAEVLPLPAGVRDALVGAPPGEARSTPLLPPERAFGPWDAAKTVRAPQRQEVPRVLDLPAPVEVEGGLLRWANATWRAEVLAEANGTARVRLTDAPPAGALLEFPDYWNDRYRLWRSRLAEVRDDALVVEHLAEPGRSVLVGGQPYRIGAEGAEVVADGNHPLAREALGFRVLLRELAFTGSGAHPLAPDATLVAFDGARLNLSDLRGKPALLDFYATWCVTCKQQAPVLARAREAYGDNLTIVSITIDPTDDHARVQAFRDEVRRSTLGTWGREIPADWLFAFDPAGEATRGFSVTGIPREVLLDADGRIRGTSVGLHPWPQLKAELDALVAGPSP